MCDEQPEQGAKMLNLEAGFAQDTTWLVGSVDKMLIQELLDSFVLEKAAHI